MPEQPFCSRRDVLRGAVAGAAAYALSPLAGWAAASAKRPLNIVFILIDDLGVMDLGVQGSTYYQTPNTDRLAAEGMRFVNGYAAHPVCSPTRASLLTGRYPHRLHLTTYIPGAKADNRRLIEPDWIKYTRYSETTYAETFRAAGYRTCHIGKWHVGAKPELQGFDVVTTAGYKKDPDDPWYVDQYTAAAEKFMTDNRDRPFLLTLSHGTVHVPLYERDEKIATYRDKPAGANGQNNPTMAAMIETMDDSVGRVLAKIKELGIEDSTAVVFFSDNGGLSTATSNKPYRGGKSLLYEGGIRVPMIIKWPGVTAPGSTCDARVISNDLYPTFLAMAGLPLKPAQHLDGMDLTPLLRGKGQLDRKTLYFHYPHYHSRAPHSAVISENWKLIRFYHQDTVQLFDLAADPGETSDLAEQKPKIAAALDAMLTRHLSTIGAQLPTPNPDYDPDQPHRKPVRQKHDPYEWKQEGDTRTYVTDPSLDYGQQWTVETMLSGQASQPTN